MPSPGKFPTTHWSLVVQAGSASSNAKHDALATLLHRYVPPLQAHLIYSKRYDPQQADDAVQSFIADSVLEKDLISLAEQGRGKFRSFLLKSLDHFVSNQRRHESARKRSPAEMVPIEDGLLIRDGQAEPGEIYDVIWAREVLAQALAMMQAECSRSRPQLWEIFEVRVLAATLKDCPPMPYSEMAERFGFASPSQAANAVVTANRMFARMLRRVVEKYEMTPQDIDEEIRDLRRALASRAAKMHP